MKNKKNILVVDDTHENLSYLTNLLEKEGCKILPADSGELALASLESNIPDLILLDIRMPGINGFDVCKQIKKNNKLAEIPVIFLTAVTEINDKLEGFRIGAVDYITKPFQKEELLARLQTHLSLREKEIELKKLNQELIIEKEKVLESKEKYAALYNEAPLSYQSLDIDGNFLDINPKWLKTLGYERNEVIGKWFGNFLKPDFVEHFRKNFPVFKKQGYINDVQFYMKKKNGEFIYISFEGCIGYTTEGEFKQTYCTFKDITKEKQAEEILKKSESNLNALINNRGESIWSLDHNFNFLIFNDFFAQEYFKSFNIELKKGMNALEILSLDLKQFWKPKYEAALAGKKTSFEFQFEINKTMHYYQVNLNPIYSDHKIVGLSAISTDITEQKTNKQLLQIQEARIQSIFRSAPIGIGVVHDRKLINVNKRFCEITGYREDELINKNAKIVYPSKEEYEYVGKEKYAQIQEHGTGTVETHFKRKSGRIIDVLLSSTPIDLNDYSKGVTFTAIDITKRKNTATELKKYRKHLEELVNERTKELEKKTGKIEDSQKAMRYLLEDVNEAHFKLEKSSEELVNVNNDLESFTYSVSHDLKAPLRAISGFANEIKESYKSDLTGDAIEYFNLIAENADKMSVLIDKLLNFSKLGRRNLNLKEIDMHILFIENWDEIKQSNKNIKTQFLINDLNKTYADKALIKQVVFNLLSNAHKFSKHNKNAKIEISCKKENKKIIYCIKDNGVGFDMKYADKLFAVFQRLHVQSDFEGTGIGLSIVKKIINKHGGEIWAESEPNKGAIFYFSLPTG